ncbi:MAG: hypothetical protein AAF570_00700 [Bacteroidota bacterium]
MKTTLINFPIRSRLYSLLSAIRYFFTGKRPAESNNRPTTAVLGPRRSPVQAPERQPLSDPRSFHPAWQHLPSTSSADTRNFVRTGGGRDNPIEPKFKTYMLVQLYGEPDVCPDTRSVHLTIHSGCADPDSVTIKRIAASGIPARTAALTVLHESRTGEHPFFTIANPAGDGCVSYVEEIGTGMALEIKHMGVKTMSHLGFSILVQTD